MKVAVIGLGRFGQSLAINLALRGAEVIAIDKDRERVNSIRDKVSLALVLNSEDREALKAQYIDKVDVAVVSIGEESFRSIVLTTIILKKMGVKKIISRAFQDIDREILEAIGADKVVFPEDESGERLARNITAPSIIDHIPLDNDETYSIIQIKAPQIFWGKKIGDLKVAAKYNVNIVLIKYITELIDKKGQKIIHEMVNPVPRADTVISESDLLWIVGNRQDVENLSKM